MKRQEQEKAVNEQLMTIMEAVLDNIAKEKLMMIMEAVKNSWNR